MKGPSRENLKDEKDVIGQEQRCIECKV